MNDRELYERAVAQQYVEQFLRALDSLQAISRRQQTSFTVGQFRHLAFLKRERQKGRLPS